MFGLSQKHENATDRKTIQCASYRLSDVIASVLDAVTHAQAIADAYALTHESANQLQLGRTAVISQMNIKLPYAVVDVSGATANPTSDSPLDSDSAKDLIVIVSSEALADMPAGIIQTIDLSVTLQTDLSASSGA